MFSAFQCFANWNYLSTGSAGIIQAEPQVMSNDKMSFMECYNKLSGNRKSLQRAGSISDVYLAALSYVILIVLENYLI